MRGLSVTGAISAAKTMKRSKYCVRLPTARFFSVITMVWLAATVTPSSVSADVPDWAWALEPRDGRVYFLAFCPRLRDREKELPECLEKAAAQAVKYRRVTVRAGRSTRRVLLFTVGDTWVDVEYDESRIEETSTRLNVVREHRSNEGTYLLAGLATEATIGSASPAFLSFGPDWIERGPVLPGYYTAVGVAKNKRLFRDSVEAADDDALAGLALQLGSESESGLLDSTRRSPRRFGHEVTAARIHGFLVIARARSNDGRYYYSLAVCPKGG